MNTRHNACVVVAIITPLAVSSAHADTLFVPTDYPTITAAMAAALGLYGDSSSGTTITFDFDSGIDLDSFRS